MPKLICNNYSRKSRYSARWGDRDAVAGNKKVKPKYSIWTAYKIVKFLTVCLLAWALFLIWRLTDWRALVVAVFVFWVAWDKINELEAQIGP